MPANTYYFFLFDCRHSSGCEMVSYYGFYLHVPNDKAMATHSSTLAWKIPWMEEPGGLQSMGS